jgi:hypothetical protein
MLATAMESKYTIQIKYMFLVNHCTSILSFRKKELQHQSLG